MPQKITLFGWNLHLVCDACSISVSFELLPVRLNELVPAQHLLAQLSEGAVIVAAKGYISYKNLILD